MKTGHPLKGVDIPPANGVNEHHKKDEEPPAVQSPPQLVANYFDGMKFIPFYSSGS